MGRSQGFHWYSDAIKEQQNSYEITAASNAAVTQPKRVVECIRRKAAWGHKVGKGSTIIAKQESSCVVRKSRVVIKLISKQNEFARGRINIISLRG